MNLNFLWTTLILINIYGLLCLANNITVGYAGLLNLACAASFAIGSYSVALAMTQWGFGFLPAIAVAVLVSAFLALLIGVGTLRYKRTSFALASLAFQTLLLAVLRNTDFAGGTRGIRDVPSPAWLGAGTASLPWYWLLSAAVLGAVIVIHRLIERSPWVLALQAARDDEIAALSMGKNVPWVRIEAFLFSSVIIALAGGLYATYVHSVHLDAFTVDESVFLLLALVCGGTCNTAGPVAGAVLAIALPEWLRFLDVPAPYAANIRNIVFGLLLILLVRWRPRGLAGRYVLD